MPKISVIVPVYNGEKYIDACVESLYKQSLKEIEVIFIDDGSTDNTLSRLNVYRNPDIIILSQKNAGAGVARNTGLSQANGEYVAFLDVDDKYADNNTLELLYNKAKENNAVICGGSLASVEGELPPNDKRVFQVEGFVNFEEYQFDFGFTRFIYKRELLQTHNIRFPNYRIYEDPVFLLKAMIQARRFYAVTEEVYVYSGAHQKDLDVKKTIDYLHGLRDNLLLSAEFGYGKLHCILFERLKSTASYYAEKNLDTLDVVLYEAMIAVNSTIDKKLLKSEGVNVSEDYLIPALHTV